MSAKSLSRMKGRASAALLAIARNLPQAAEFLDLGVACKHRDRADGSEIRGPRRGWPGPRVSPLCSPRAHQSPRRSSVPYTRASLGVTPDTLQSSIYARKPTKHVGVRIASPNILSRHHARRFWFLAFPLGDREARRFRCGPVLTYPHTLGSGPRESLAKTQTCRAGIPQASGHASHRRACSAAGSCFPVVAVRHTP